MCCVRVNMSFVSLARKKSKIFIYCDIAKKMSVFRSVIKKSCKLVSGPVLVETMPFEQKQIVLNKLPVVISNNFHVLLKVVSFC